jgi:hypothetical protein
MKKIGITLLLSILIVQGFSQNLSAEQKPGNQSDSSSVTKVVVGEDKLTVTDDGKELNLRIGNRGLTILESLEGGLPKFELNKYNNPEPPACDNNDNDNSSKSKRSHFKGHWSGINIGFNNYLTDNYSSSLPAGIDYMSLNTGKAVNFNLNFTQLSIGLTRHIGFVTGLGLNWNNYRFDGNNNIEKNSSGNIVELDPGEPLKKSKLSTLYLHMPLLFEIQVPTDHKRIDISAGLIGAVKLGSHTKMVFEDKSKEKSDGDLNLNMLRYGFTARVGYENFAIYGTYYKTPLFQSGKGPGGVDLFPYEIGIAFTID